MCDQPGVGFTDDNEIEGQKSSGSNGNASSISRSCDKGKKRGAESARRSARNARRPKIPAASEVRHAGVARGAAAVRARLRSSNAVNGTGVIARSNVQTYTP